MRKHYDDNLKNNVLSDYLNNIVGVRILACITQIRNFVQQ